MTAVVHDPVTARTEAGSGGFVARGAPHDNGSDRPRVYLELSWRTAGIAVGMLVFGYLTYTHFDRGGRISELSDKITALEAQVSPDGVAKTATAITNLHDRINALESKTAAAIKTLHDQILANDAKAGKALTSAIGNLLAELAAFKASVAEAVNPTVDKVNRIQFVVKPNGVETIRVVDLIKTEGKK